MKLSLPNVSLMGLLESILKTVPVLFSDMKKGSVPASCVAVVAILPVLLVIFIFATATIAGQPAQQMRTMDTALLIQKLEEEISMIKSAAIATVSAMAVAIGVLYRWGSRTAVARVGDQKEQTRLRDAVLEKVAEAETKVALALERLEGRLSK